MTAQLVFDFMIYDIFSDTTRSVNRLDCQILQEVYQAYAHVRVARSRYMGSPLAHELDEIHRELMAKVNEIKEVDSARSV